MQGRRATATTLPGHLIYVSQGLLAQPPKGPFNGSATFSSSPFILYIYIYTRSKISFPSGFRTQLLLSSTHYKHPERVSLSPTISSNVTLPQYRSQFVTYSPPCTRESQRGLEPSKLGDMSLELEEFDLRGFEETEGDRMEEEE